MRISWKAAIVPATVILLIFLVFIAPVIEPAQATYDLTPTVQGQSNPFVLKATKIDGTNAHLQTLPDPAYPVFTFSSTTINGLQIIAHATSGATLTTTASGPAYATNVAIKTAIGYEIATALASFDNKADLLILAAGGTVPHLTMSNVTLVIDHYLKSATFRATGLKLAITNSAMTTPAPSQLTLAQVVATLTPVAGICATPTTLLPTPSVCTTPTVGVPVTATPTLASGSTPTSVGAIPPVSSNKATPASAPSPATGSSSSSTSSKNSPGSTNSTSSTSSASNSNQQGQNNQSFLCRTLKIGC